MADEEASFFGGVFDDDLVAGYSGEPGLEVGIMAGGIAVRERAAQLDARERELDDRAAQLCRSEELLRERAARLRRKAAEVAGARTVAKVGRNEPCPCGWGFEYKLCHGLLRNR